MKSKARGRDEAEEDLHYWGATDAQIREALEDSAEHTCEVWEENVRTFEIFCGLRTQWRIGPMGGVIGLDYGSVAALLHLQRVRDREVVFSDLQAMEIAALEVLNADDG